MLLLFWLVCFDGCLICETRKMESTFLVNRSFRHSEEAKNCARNKERDVQYRVEDGSGSCPLDIA